MRDLLTDMKNAAGVQTTSPVELRFATGSAGEISGYGSVFGIVDMYGDIINPGAFGASLRKHQRDRTRPAMLWCHDPSRPIGSWETFEEDAYGLKVAGKLNLATEAGRDANEHLKAGDLDGLSIGFNVMPNGSKRDPKTGIRHLTEIDLWEVSIVPFPANEKARITSVKSAGDITSRADFEGFLRDHGFAKAAARRLGSGWNALAGADDIDDSAARELLAAIKSSNSDLKKERKP